jgi:hypothetical protein
MHKKMDLLANYSELEASLPPKVTGDPQISGIEPHFANDMFDLMSRLRSGHAASHVFAKEGFKIWDAFTWAAANYPFHSDVQLIRDHPGFYSDQIRPVGRQGRVAVIDMGPGSEHAIRNKTVPFLKAVGATTYIPVDRSLEPIATSIAIAKEEIKDLTTQFRLADFFLDDFHFNFKWEKPIDWNKSSDPAANNLLRENLPEDCTRVFVNFGCTYGNMEGFPGDKMPKEQLTSAFRTVASHMRPGDLLVAAFDHNQDKAGLDACYGHPKNAELVRSVLNRIPVEIPTHNLSIKDFPYWGEWMPDTHMYGLGFEAKKDLSFTMLYQQLKWKEGERSTLANAWKYPTRFVEETSSRAGLEIKAVLADSREWIHHYVFGLER